MSPSAFRSRRLLAAALLATLAACSSDTELTSPPPRAAITPYLQLAPASTNAIDPGQTLAFTATLIDATGTPRTEPITWTSGTPTVATISATGVVTGVSGGTTVITARAGTVSATFTIAVRALPAIRINEIESNMGTPGDWVELFNASGAAVDVSGWTFRDNDATRTPYRIPNGTTIPANGYLVLEEAAFGFGLGSPDEARLSNNFGVEVDAHGWPAHAATTLGRCPNATGGFVTMNTVTKGAANDCRPLLRINEVESSGGTPGDWIEIINIGTTPVDLSNFLVKDDDDARTSRLPAGATIAPGGFYVIEEAVMGFGLGGADAARLFDANGLLLDSYTWTAHAATTYGRCPDGTGAFTTTGAVTKGAANDCSTTTAPTPTAWPGSNDVRVADVAGTFGGNMSGLTIEGARGGAPAVLWASRNGPGSLYRLLYNGTNWIPDATNGWATGKLLRYPDGTGDVDAEGVTIAGASSAGVYVAAERNNSANSVSRNSILRFDVSGAGAALTATQEWNLTADVPATAANAGLEAITWVPDTLLVRARFFDESRNRAYAPADYPNHGDGVFFVGVEATGAIYAYVLNHANGTFTRVATFASSFPGVMGLEFDVATGYLWATCDDGCGGLSAVFEIDANLASPTVGRFIAPRRFARPGSMPNINNEGFAFGSAAECVAGRKPVVWADDSETGGNALRTATIPCGLIAPAMLASRPPSSW